MSALPVIANITAVPVGKSTSNFQNSYVSILRNGTSITPGELLFLTNVSVNNSFLPAFIRTATFTFSLQSAVGVLSNPYAALLDIMTVYILSAKQPTQTSDNYTIIMGRTQADAQIVGDNMYINEVDPQFSDTGEVTFQVQLQWFYGSMPATTRDETNTYCWPPNTTALTVFQWLAQQGGATLAFTTTALQAQLQGYTYNNGKSKPRGMSSMALLTEMAIDFGLTVKATNGGKTITLGKLMPGNLSSSKYYAYRANTQDPNTVGTLLSFTPNLATPGGTGQDIRGLDDKTHAPIKVQQLYPNSTPSGTILNTANVLPLNTFLRGGGGNQNSTQALIVNRLNAAKNYAHATRQSITMYQGAVFIANGTATVIGDADLQVLDMVFLDGLGVLWSGYYVVMNCTHEIGYDAGFKCILDCWTDSLGGSPNSSAQNAAGNLGSPFSSSEDEGNAALTAESSAGMGSLVGGAGS